MIRMFFRHPVVDYAKWKKGYDDFEVERPGCGVIDHAVYQATDDPNDVTGWHDFETSQAAHEFAGSEQLRKAMESAGVAGEPTIWFTTPG